MVATCKSKEQHFKLIESLENTLIKNICPLYDSLCNLNLYSNQWFYTHFWLCNSDMYLHLCSLTSSSTNSIYGSISRGCILDTSSFIAKIISTYPCSWFFCDFFSYWLPPLRSYGFSVYISVSWIAALPPLKLFH